MRSFFSTTRASIENPSTPINGDTLGALFQRSSAAGVAVDEYSIIGLPAFYRATQILGGVIASLPFDIIEKGTDGSLRIAKEHPNYKIVSREPSQFYTAHTFYKTMVLHYLSHGVFYAAITRNANSQRITSLLILDPVQMESYYNTRGELLFRNKKTNKKGNVTALREGKAYKEAMRGFEPSNVRELIMQVFAGRPALKTESFLREITKNPSEAEIMKWAHDKNGMGMDELSIQISEIWNDSHGGDISTRDIRNEIIDVLGSYKSRNDMRSDLIKANEEQQFIAENGTTKEELRRAEQYAEADELAETVTKEKVDEEVADSIDESVDQLTDKEAQDEVDKLIAKFTDDKGNIDWDALHKEDSTFNTDILSMPEKAQELLTQKINESRGTKKDATKESIEPDTESKGGTNIEAGKSREVAQKELALKKQELAEAESDYNKANKALTSDLASKQSVMFGGKEQKMFDDTADMKTRVDALKKKVARLQGEVDILQNLVDENLPGQQKMALKGDLQKAKDAVAEAKKKSSDTKSDGDKLGVRNDPFEQAKREAEADRELFDAYVDLAKEYVKYGVKTVEDFAKQLGEEVTDVIKRAWESANGDIIPNDLGDGVKKTIVTKRAYEGEFREGVKKELEKIGLTREIESQAEAKAKAIQFVDSVGEETALEAVRNNDVSDASGAYVWNELIERNEKKILTEKNPERIAELEAEQARLIEEFGVKATSGGRFAAALGDIYEKSDLGYNLQKKISEYKEQNGGVIPEEVEARFREYDKQLKDIKTRLAEAEQRAKEAEEKTAMANIEEEVARDKKKSRPVIYGKKRIAKGLDDLASALGAKLSVAGDEAVKITDALSEIGRGLIEEGVATTENVWEKVKEYVADKFGDKLKDIDRYESDVKVKIADEKTTGTIKISKNLIKELVASGINNIDDLTAAVKDRVKDEYPKATDREIRDAITGYGKTTNLNQDDIAVQMRKINRAGKIISSLEDIAKKKRPLKSGAQRDKLDVEERAMRKQLREAMKGLPLDEGALEEQLRTQLDASKQRVLNQIEDLERELNNGELVPKDARTVKEDAELKSLKEKRDALKKEHDAIFKDESFKEARRLELTKKANERRLEELKKKLKEGDFSKKTRKPLIADDELIKLKAEKLRIQEQYDVEFYKNKLANRTKAEKVKDSVWELWSLPRALMATGEWSFVGVQGLKLSLSHPQYAAQAFKNAWNSMLSENNTAKFLNGIKSQEWYPTLKNSKLSLTEPHAEVTAREETFNSSWSNLVWNLIGYPTKYVSDSAYEKWIAANPMKALERASVGYLDTMRVLRFLDGMETLREQGKTFENSPQDYKDVADMVNTLTGRASLGPAEQIAEPLSKLFFSPRNWASAFKTGTPYAFYHFGKMTPTARKMALADFSKYLGLTTSGMMLAAVGLNNDDDPKTGVEMDPRSTDFMKIRLGKKRVDPWGGMQQQMVFSARIMADLIADATPQYSEGGYKDYKGDILRLGESHKAPTKQELALRVVVNKLGPSAALFNKYMSSRIGKDDIRIDQYGKPVSLKSVMAESSHPIFWGTVADLYNDDKSALNGLLAFYSFFGGGVNIQEDKGGIEAIMLERKMPTVKRTAEEKYMAKQKTIQTEEGLKKKAEELGIEYVPPKSMQNKGKSAWKHF